MFLGEQLKLDRFDPDYYPIQLGNHVLGGGLYACREVFDDLGLRCLLSRCLQDS